jgi:hypothetical protein
VRAKRGPRYRIRLCSGRTRLEQVIGPTLVDETIVPNSKRSQS